MALAAFLGAKTTVPVTPFDNLDFNLAALLGWISFTLAALSSTEKAACRSLAFFEVLTFLIKALRVSARFLLRAVLVLSFLTFLIADRIIGMASMVS